MKLHFFIGYDSKEDIAYRVCKHSLLKRSSIDERCFFKTRRTYS